MWAGGRVAVRRPMRSTRRWWLRYAAAWAAMLLAMSGSRQPVAQELDAEEGLLDPDLEPGVDGEASSNATARTNGVDGTEEQQELQHPPRPKPRSARAWLPLLTSLPQNCANGTGGRPELTRLPIRLPGNRVPLKDLFMTRENYARLGLQSLAYPHSLPPTALAVATRYKWRSCAVVGNSGTLLDSQFGASIDKHDVVIRMNQAPTKGWELHVGHKTTFRIMNSLWSHRYAHGYAPWDPGYRNLPLEKSSTLIMSRVAVTVYNTMFEFWHNRRPDITLLLLSSRVVSIIRQLLIDYRARLCHAGYGPYMGGNTPSSGYVGVYLAMQMCSKVAVYGFGVKEVGGEKVSYHYYTGYAARKVGTEVHAFDVESHIIEALDSMGYVKLCKHSAADTPKAKRGFAPEFHTCGVA